MKPIIFSTPEVQAILEGRKTQFRRAIKVVAPHLWKAVNNCRENSEYGASVPCYLHRVKATEERGVYYPRYDVGDVLYVRETFCEVPYEHNCIPIKDGYITMPKYAYKADSKVDYTGIWCSPVAMPKEVARLFLQVKSVRIERLQEITAHECVLEGINTSDILEKCPDGNFAGHAKQSYARLWDSHNAKRGYGWDTNPWVWVVEFEREQAEVAPLSSTSSIYSVRECKYFQPEEG